MSENLGDLIREMQSGSQPSQEEYRNRPALIIGIPGSGTYDPNTGPVTHEHRFVTVGELVDEITFSPSPALLREVYEKAMRGKRHLGLFLPEWHDAHEVYADLRDVLQKLAPYVERREG